MTAVQATLSTGGSPLARICVREIRRHPWRFLLTAVSIGAAVACWMATNDLNFDSSAEPPALGDGSMIPFLSVGLFGFLVSLGAFLLGVSARRPLSARLKLHGASPTLLFLLTFGLSALMGALGLALGAGVTLATASNTSLQPQALLLSAASILVAALIASLVTVAPTGSSPIQSFYKAVGWGQSSLWFPLFGALSLLVLGSGLAYAGVFRVLPQHGVFFAAGSGLILLGILFIFPLLFRPFGRQSTPLALKNLARNPLRTGVVGGAVLIGVILSWLAWQVSADDPTVVEYPTMISLVSGAAVIVSIIALSVATRGRELALRRAMGVRRITAAGMIAAEAAAASAVAAFLGAASCFLIGVALRQYFGSGQEQFALPVLGLLVFGSITLSVSFAFTWAFLAARTPARGDIEAA